MTILEGFVMHRAVELSERIDRVVHLAEQINDKVDANHAELTARMDELGARMDGLASTVQANHVAMMAAIAALRPA